VSQLSNDLPMAADRAAVRGQLSHETSPSSRHESQHHYRPRPTEAFSETQSHLPARSSFQRVTRHRGITTCGKRTPYIAAGRAALPACTLERHAAGAGA